MKNSFIIKKKLNIFKVLLIIFILCFYSNSTETEINDEKIASTLVDSKFEIHFIDVGEADSTLVICNNQTMLIDGGNVEDSSFLYSYLKKNNIKHLNYVIATHAHEDHVGGIPGALNFATFDNVFSPTLSYESKAFNDFLKYVHLKNKKILIPNAGDTFNFSDAKVIILACNSYEETNNTSIILKIIYKDTSFLLMADAEREVEKLLLKQNLDLSSTLLKVGHHGSDTSTTYEFLREVMPMYGIISVGKDNAYGHPHDITISKLENANVEIFRTDLNGTIICKSDGKNLTFITQE